MQQFQLHFEHDFPLEMHAILSIDSNAYIMPCETKNLYICNH